MYEKPNFSEPSGLDTFRAAAESFQRPLETPAPAAAPAPPEPIKKSGLSKETKIGLVVIGSLIVVFGALLVRKFSPDALTPAPEEIARTGGQTPSSAGMDARPSVVLPQLGLAERVESAGQAQSPAAEGTVDAANRNFMPAEQSATDRYHQAEPARATSENTKPTETAANPFVHKASAAEAADLTIPDASDVAESPAASGLELPVQEAAPAPAPVRRLNPAAPTRNGQELTEAPRFGAEPSSEEPIAEEPAAEESSTAANEPVEDNQPAADEDVPVDIEPANEPVSEPARPVRPTRAAPAFESAGDIGPIEPAHTAPEDERPTAAGRDWRAGATELHRAPVEPQAPPANGKYTVQPNDSLWIISEKVYGTGGYFQALREHNRAVLPRADKLVVGSTLAVPPVMTLEQNFPSLCPKPRKSALVKPRTMQASTQGRRATGSNVYVVEQGDTLFDIARYELGKASRWAEIYDLNRDVLGEDFDHLSPGTELTLPAKQGANSFTRQDDSRYQR